MLIQFIAASAVFAFIYTVQFFNNPFCNWVKNEVAYTLNYTVSMESMYKSSQEVMQYLAGKIEEGQIYINTNGQPDSVQQAAPASGAAEPTAAPSPTPDSTLQPSDDAASRPDTARRADSVGDRI